MNKNQFPSGGIVLDDQCDSDKLPQCAERKPAVKFGPFAHFVPVAFVAKDWSVSSRRIRALLSTGRLVGQLQANGYWEVRYPYIFTMGTRGPSLKCQQRPAKGLRVVVDNTERRPA